MDLKLEPLRSLDDYVLNSARFQIPDVTNLDRWNTRVKENLIYYQTNYFLTAIIIFLIVGVLHPADMLIGIVVTIGAYLAINYVLNNQTLLNDFKQKHPVVCLLGVVGLTYFIVSLISSVLVFCFGILLPIVVIFFHASFRLRDIKNKLSNIKEKFHLKTTPMGLILEELGMAVDDLVSH